MSSIENTYDSEGRYLSATEQLWNGQNEAEIVRLMAEEDAERQEVQRLEQEAHDWLIERGTIKGPDEFRSDKEIAESLGWLALGA